MKESCYIYDQRSNYLSQAFETLALNWVSFLALLVYVLSKTFKLYDFHIF